MAHAKGLGQTTYVLGKLVWMAGENDGMPVWLHNLKCSFEGEREACCLSFRPE